MNQHSVLVNLVIKADTPEQATSFAWQRLAEWLCEHPTVPPFPAGTLLLYGKPGAPTCRVCGGVLAETCDHADAIGGSD